MLDVLFTELEGSGFAAALRGSMWAYPLVNVAHILGIALLFGAIVPLDLRLLGLWRGVPVSALSRVLTPVAMSGLLIAVPAGALLFSTRAGEYADSALFQAKMLIVALGLANALWLRWLYPRDRRAATDGAVPIAARTAAALSLVLWPGAILLGRLVGYF